MKKLFFYVFIILAAVITYGCSAETDVMKDTAPPLNEGLTGQDLALIGIYNADSFYISEIEAIERAKEIMMEFDSDLMTRSEGGDREVGAVIPLTTESLANQEHQYVSVEGEVVTVELPPVLGYAVNFIDNATQSAGFVIIPADTRIQHNIIATVPYGAIPAGGNEKLENDGLIFYLDNLEEYATWRIVESERKADSLRHAITETYQHLYPDKTIEVEFESIDETETRAVGSIFRRLRVTTTTTVHQGWHDVSSVAPLIPVEWGQREPFNAQVSSKAKCNNAVTGCVITATAQLMAYWKHPASVGGKPMDWARLNRRTGTASWTVWEGTSYNRWDGPMSSAAPELLDQISYLNKHIGESVGADYHCSTVGCRHCGGGGTGALTSKAVTHLKNHGYKVLPTGLGYNWATVKSMLDAEKPILICGFSSKTKHKFLGITIYSSYSGGHTWNIDGYKERKRVLKVTTQLVDTSNGRILSSSTQYANEYDNLIHNNWGWDGSSNGYFTAGVFDSNSRVATSDTRGTDNYYQYNIDCWYNIFK